MRRFVPWQGVVVLVVLTACSQQPAPPVPTHNAPVQAADVSAPTELFFSEYVEGSANNKALEIYNGTGSSVDLAAAGYNVQMFFNGSATAGLTIDLTGTVADGDVFVLAQSGAGPTVLAAADQTNGAVWFDGDDAALLRKGTTVVDAIGQVGTDPGTQWGTGLTSTQDNTLRRKSSVCAGDTNAADAFEPSLEWDGYASDTFGGLGAHAITACSQPPTVELGACGDPATFLHEVQGSGDTSPLAGQTVNVEAVVVGDFQPGDGDAFNSDLGGFFLQEEDADADADPTTSEGVFVYAPSAANVHVGDVVRLRGKVSEYHGLTELGSVSAMAVCSTDATMPTPATVTLPVTHLGAFEQVEGMRVLLPGPLVISESFDFDRYGEIVLASPTGPLAAAGRLFQPTAVHDPDSTFFSSAWTGLQLRRITLDDGRTAQNPDPARHPNGSEFTLTNRFRGGDTLQNVVGVMDYSNNQYDIQPTDGATYTAQNPRPTAPDAVGGTVRVAGLNVFNYFTTIDTGAALCGPTGGMECRGADTAQELGRQRAKIVAALDKLDAHVVGLTEIQNPALGGPDTALDDLVAGLDDAAGAGAYAAIHTGTIGTDAIKVALIYQPAVVMPVGAYKILDSSVDPTFLDTKNRPALAQTFEAKATGERFTVVVNHLKSKSGACNDVGDPNTGDGQSECNLTRTRAAEALLDWLATDPTASHDPDFLLVGDFNSYDHEDPISTLTTGGFADLLKTYQGEYAYSYLYDGMVGYLDYGLSNASLTPQVTGATAWHINADEPDILDYDMTYKLPAQDALYQPAPYRTSDHDPVLIGLAPIGPTCSAATPSPAILWPPNHKLVPISILGVTSTGGSVTLTVTGIRQDELVDAPGDLDGATSPDGQGVGTNTPHVRAERLEGGNGRVYRVAFTATDAAGQTCAGDVTVTVPSNQGASGAAIEDTPLVDSTQP